MPTVDGTGQSMDVRKTITIVLPDQTRAEIRAGVEALEAIGLPVTPAWALDGNGRVDGIRLEVPLEPPRRSESVGDDEEIAA